MIKNDNSASCTKPIKNKLIIIDDKQKVMNLSGYERWLPKAGEHLYQDCTNYR